MPKNATNEKNKFSEIKIFSKIYKGKIFQKFTAQFHRARRTVFYKSILISRVLKRVKLAKHRNKAPPTFIVVLKMLVHSHLLLLSLREFITLRLSFIRAYYATTEFKNWLTNTPRVFHVKTTWKRPFALHFHLEYMCCVSTQLLS